MKITSIITSKEAILVFAIIRVVKTDSSLKRSELFLNNLNLWVELNLENHLK